MMRIRVFLSIVLHCAALCRLFDGELTSNDIRTIYFDESQIDLKFIRSNSTWSRFQMASRWNVIRIWTKTRYNASVARSHPREENKCWKGTHKKNRMANTLPKWEKCLQNVIESFQLHFEFNIYNVSAWLCWLENAIPFIGMRVCFIRSCILENRNKQTNGKKKKCDRLISTLIVLVCASVFWF